MSIYFDYLSEDERELYIEEKSIENEFYKLNTIYEMVCMKYEQMQKEAEYKVFSESGTYDDLAFLIQEADQEVNQQKENIFQKIINFFKNLFGKITGKTNKIKNSQLNDDELIEVPSDLEKNANAIISAENELKAGIQDIQSMNFKSALNRFSKISANIALVTIGGAVTYTQIKKRKGVEISNAMERVKNFVSPAVDKVSQVTSKIFKSNQGDDAKKSFNPLQKIVSVISSIITAIENGINKVFKKKADPNANKNEQNSRQLFKNGVKEVNDSKGGKYLIDRVTGDIRHEDKDGNELPVDKNNIPPNILKMSQQLKGRAAGLAQAAKKQAEINNKVQSQRASVKIFTPEETGVKVYIDPHTARLFVNNKLINIEPNMGSGKIKKLLKKSGVTNKFDEIVQAIGAAHMGVQKANVAQNAYDSLEEKKQKQLRTESVCDFINERLSDTVLEAVVEDDYISFVAYNIEPQSVSPSLISMIESEGYTVNITDNYYEIYE